jgi:tetratricopeptide (TPR) repeat protein
MQQAVGLITTQARLADEKWRSALGRLAEAIEYHEAGLQIAKELDDDEGIALNLRDLGPCYEDQGKIETAIDYCYQSLDVIKTKGVKRHEGGAYLNLGNYFVRLGRYDTAFENYIKSEAWYLKQDGPYGRGWALVQYRLGYAHLLRGNVTLAQELCRKVIPHVDDMELRAAQNEARYFLGLTCLTQKDLGEASKWLQDAETFDHPRFAQNISAALGITALKSKNLSSARIAFQKTIQIADRKIANFPDILDAWDMKGIAGLGLALCGEEAMLIAAHEAFHKGTLDGISLLLDLMDVSGSDPSRTIATCKP